MSFVIRSEILIRQNIPPNPEQVKHSVLVRQKNLSPSEYIAIKGQINRDEEGKGPWKEVKGKLRIITNDQIRLIIDGEDEILRGTNLGWLHYGPFSFFNLTTQLSEIFTFIDRIRIPRLTDKMLSSLEGMKRVDSVTTLIYQPEDSQVINSFTTERCTLEYNRLFY